MKLKNICEEVFTTPKREDSPFKELLAGRGVMAILANEKYLPDTYQPPSGFDAYGRFGMDKRSNQVWMDGGPSGSAAGHPNFITFNSYWGVDYGARYTDPTTKKQYAGLIYLYGKTKESEAWIVKNIKVILQQVKRRIPANKEEYFKDIRKKLAEKEAMKAGTAQGANMAASVKTFKEEVMEYLNESIKIKNVDNKENNEYKPSNKFIEKKKKEANVRDAMKKRLTNPQNRLYSAKTDEGDGNYEKEEEKPKKNLKLGKKGNKFTLKEEKYFETLFDDYDILDEARSYTREVWLNARPGERKASEDYKYEFGSDIESPKKETDEQRKKRYKEHYSKKSKVGSGAYRDSGMKTKLENGSLYDQKKDDYDDTEEEFKARKKFKFGKKQSSVKVKCTGKEPSVKVTGFKNVQNEIAKKGGYDKETAAKILASKTRNASQAAKAKNPNLLKVK